MPIIDAIIAIAGITGWYFFWKWAIDFMWDTLGPSIIEMQQRTGGE